MNDLKLAITILLICFITGNLLGQEKYEKERRIPTKEIPSSALNFIDSINIKSKVKWYLEEGLNSKSVEAKFKRNSKKYSIEFGLLGNLEDAEIEIKFNELPKSIQQSISNELKKDCSKFKVNKVQIQYSGSPSSVLLKILKSEDHEDLITNYELVIRCKSEKKIALYEYLFSESGEVLSSSEIIFKNSSHLEY
jgi:hypothetical protein